MIGLLLRCNTMKCQLQSTSGTLPGTYHNMSAEVQNKFLLSSVNEMSVTVNKCQVPYLEMSGTHPITGIHETLRY